MKSFMLNEKKEMKQLFIFTDNKSHTNIIFISNNWNLLIKNW